MHVQLLQGTGDFSILTSHCQDFFSGIFMLAPPFMQIFKCELKM